jgi:hypothetical protein
VVVTQAAADATRGLDGPGAGTAEPAQSEPTTASAERCWKGRPERVRVP